MGGDSGHRGDLVRRSLRQWVECHIKVSDARSSVKVGRVTSCGQYAPHETCRRGDTGEYDGSLGGAAQGSGTGDGPHRVDADDDGRHRVERQLVAHVAARQDSAIIAASARAGQRTASCRRCASARRRRRRPRREPAAQLAHRDPRSALDEPAELRGRAGGAASGASIVGRASATAVAVATGGRRAASGGVGARRCGGHRLGLRCGQARGCDGALGRIDGADGRGDRVDRHDRARLTRARVGGAGRPLGSGTAGARWSGLRMSAVTATPAHRPTKREGAPARRCVMCRALGCRCRAGDRDRPDDTRERDDRPGRAARSASAGDDQQVPGRLVERRPRRSSPQTTMSSIRAP